MRVLLLVATILLITPFFTNAQKPIPKIVTAQEFIGQNGALNAYDIETDSRGYVYIVSDLGLNSFNGFELRNDNFHHKKGLIPYYSAIHKDYDGDLWFSSNKGISYLEKDSLLAYPVPASVLRLGTGKFETVYQDKDGLLHISPRWYGHLTVDIHGNVKEVDTKQNTDIHGFVVTQLEDGSWFHYSISSKEKDGTFISIYYLNNKNELKKIAETDERDVDYHSSLVQHADNSLSISLGSKTLIRFKGDKLINQKKFDFDIINLFVDSRNDLWIGTLGNGALQSKNSNLADITSYYEGNFAVVTESDDGGLWFKSSKMGFGYLPPNSVNHYSEQNGYDEINDIAVVNVVNERICFSTRKGKVYFVNGNNLEQLEPPINDYFAHAKEVCFDKRSGTYWLAFNEVIYGIHEGKVTTIKLDSARFINKKIICLKNIGGRIFGITNLHFFEIKNNEIINVSEKTTIGSFQDFTQDDQGNFWLVGEAGIGIIKGKRVTRLPYEMPDNLNGNVSLVFFAQGSVWALFLNNTLIKLNLKTYSIVVDQKNDPVEIMSYTIGNKGEIWGITADFKLIRLTKTKHWNTVKTETFETPKHYIDIATKYHMAFLNERLYIGAKYGLFELKIKDLKPGSNSSKLIFQILINSKKVDFSKSYTLNHSQKDLQIEFDAIDFNRRALIFSYMLEGYDTTWRETKYKQIHYTNLSPGKYQLKLRSKTKNGKWTQPEVITFEITPPFWQTWWFRISAIVFFLLLIFLFFKWRLNQVQLKEKAKSKVALDLARLEMQALKAQINPHFIFNSITSAMYYLAKNENDKVESYLQRFSKLVRRVLENSDKSVVRLMEEMELIRLYVKLESEQFEGEPIELDVEYTGEGLDRVNVPPTLFQPYIENAIHHGLRTKRGKRYIKLSFEVMENELNIQIQDNGIGRVAAQKEAPNNQTKSFGMLISSRRIELLNQTKFSEVKVNDLYDENGMASGTCVIFKIPYLNHDS